MLNRHILITVVLTVSALLAASSRATTIAGPSLPYGQGGETELDGRAPLRVSEDLSQLEPPFDQLAPLLLDIFRKEEYQHGRMGPVAQALSLIGPETFPVLFEAIAGVGPSGALRTSELFEPFAALRHIPDSAQHWTGEWREKVELNAARIAANRALLPVFRAAILGEHEYGRAVAAYHVGTLGLDLHEIAPLLAIALEDPSARVRRSAVTAFTLSNRISATTTVEASDLANDPEGEVLNVFLRILSLQTDPDGHTLFAVEKTMTDCADKVGPWAQAIDRLFDEASPELAEKWHFTRHRLNLPFTGTVDEAVALLGAPGSAIEFLFKSELNDAQLQALLRYIDDDYGSGQDNALQVLRCQAASSAPFMEPLATLVPTLPLESLDEVFDVLSAREDLSPEMQMAMEDLVLRLVDNARWSAAQMVATLAGRSDASLDRFRVSMRAQQPDGRRILAAGLSHVIPQDLEVFDTLRANLNVKDLAYENYMRTYVNHLRKALARCIAARPAITGPKVRQDLEQAINEATRTTDSYSSTPHLIVENLAGALTIAGVSTTEALFHAMELEDYAVVDRVIQGALSAPESVEAEFIRFVEGFIGTVPRQRAELTVNSLARMAKSNPHARTALWRVAEDELCSAQVEAIAELHSVGIEAQERERYLDLMARHLPGAFDEAEVSTVRIPRGCILEFQDLDGSGPTLTELGRAVYSLEEDGSRILADILESELDHWAKSESGFSFDGEGEWAPMPAGQKIEEVLFCLHELGPKAMPARAAVIRALGYCEFAPRSMHVLRAMGLPFSTYSNEVRHHFEESKDCSQNLMYSAQQFGEEARSLLDVLLRDDEVEHWDSLPENTDRIARMNAILERNYRIHTAIMIGGDDPRVLDVLRALLTDNPDRSVLIMTSEYVRQRVNARLRAAGR